MRCLNELTAYLPRTETCQLHGQRVFTLFTSAKLPNTPLQTNLYESAEIKYCKSFDDVGGIGADVERGGGEGLKTRINV